MARPWSRKGKGDNPDDKAPDAGDDDVDLNAVEHAWWAQRDEADLSAQTSHPELEDRAEREDGPKRDILAEHFGADWRSSFGFDHTYLRPSGPAEEAAEDAPEIDMSDPYAVLEVDPGASWEDIVNAHRRQARRHHPDRMGGQPEAIIAAAEDRIRHINVAYQELRVRRGK